MKLSGKERFGSNRNLMLILVFLAFPLLLLHISLNSYFSLQKQQHRNLLFNRARKILLRINEFADGARFFELLLERHFKHIDSADNQSELLKNRIGQLKKKFPGAFSFIVWNKNGKLDKNLTDNPSFVVFLNRLNSFMKELQQLTLRYFPARTVIPSELNRQIRSFRRILGPFIPAGKIAESFVPTQQRRCFQMHGKGNQAYGWYTAQPGYSILVYIDYETVHSMCGAKKLCLRLNLKNTGIKAFLFDEEQGRFYPPISDKLKSQILLNKEKLDQLYPPELLESEESLFGFQSLRPGWSALAVSEKKSLLDFDQKAMLYLLRVVFALLAIIILSRCFFVFYGNPLASIRFKLLAVFIYSVAVPMMIFSTVAFEYISQKLNRLERDYGINLVQSLNTIDQEFDNYLKTKADQINRSIDLFIKTRKPEIENLEKWNDLALTLKKRFKPNSFLLFDKKGNDLYERRFSREFMDSTFPRSMAVDLLDFLNDRKLKEYKQVKVITEASVLSFKKTRRNINPMSLVDQQFLFYTTEIRLKSKLYADLFLQVFWDMRPFQIDFFSQLYRDSKFSRNFKPVLYFEDSGAVFPETLNHPELVSFLKNVGLYGTRIGQFENGSMSYLAAGLRGNFLEDSVLVGLMDYKQLELDKKQLKQNIFYLLLLSFLFSLALYMLLSSQILFPLEKLAVGVEKVRQMDFHYRIDLNTENEFGRLAGSVNHTLENLAELEIAKVVQEALLPEKGLENSEFQVLGRTRSMTKLGGDYYDFYMDANNNLKVFVADAAGHGIQAALMMAMAKSVLILESGGEESVLMESMNRTFYELRQSSIKTMITGQLLSFSGQAGKLINAGHCYPILLDPKGKNSTEIVQGSLPFGYSKNRRFDVHEFEIRPGSIIVLYTDGIIESCNANGKPLGMPGFLDLIERAFSQNLDEFYLRLMAAILAWQPDQKDDLTLVLIRRKNEVV